MTKDVASFQKRARTQDRQGMIARLPGPPAKRAVKTVTRAAIWTAGLISSILLVSLTSLIPNILANTFGQPEETLARGKFLVAASILLDSNFSETVIYLVSYNTRGAMGIVINRPQMSTWRAHCHI